MERVCSIFLVSNQGGNPTRTCANCERVIESQQSVHYEAEKALHRGICDLVSVLKKLCDQKKNIDVRGQIGCILAKKSTTF